MSKPKIDEIDWRKPLSPNDILTQLDTFSADTVDYRKDLILGFPTTTPHEINQTIAEKYTLQQSNAIGLHTKKDSDTLSERGFAGIQQAEREVIGMTADILGAPPHEIDGYLCTGATEGNIVGLWIARNKFKNQDTVVISSALSHYSLQKGLGLLNFPKESLRLVESDENGHVSIEAVEHEARESVERGARNIVFFANAGTTMLGSVDDVTAINKVAEDYASQGVNVYIHVDAAFGGMMAPFLDHVTDIGFKNKHVMSVAVDLHKTGKAPFGSGVIMTRKNLFEHIETHTPYFLGNDHTLSGSRPGIIALQSWATMRSIGKEGYRKRANDFFKTAGAILNFLEDHTMNCFKNDLNVVAVKGDPSDAIKKKYITHIQYNFPVDLKNINNFDSGTIWNIVVLDHTKDLIEDFFKDVEESKK